MASHGEIPEDMAVNWRRLASGLEIEPLVAQIADHAELWNADPCWIPRTAAYAPDNIVIRYDHKDRHWRYWDKPARKLLSAVEPILDTMMGRANCRLLGKVGITRMAAGDVLGMHVDATRRPVYFERYQVPLDVGDAEFLIDGEVVPMIPGTAVWFDKTAPHGVTAGTTPRLAMVVEMHIA